MCNYSCCVKTYFLLQLIVVALCGLTLVSLIINMNVAFNVSEAVRPMKIAAILREEMGSIMRNIKKAEKFQDMVILFLYLYLLDVKLISCVL